MDDTVSQPRGNDAFWGLFQIVPDTDGGKPQKKPRDLLTGQWPISPFKAFVHPLDAVRPQPGAMLGYHPDPESRYVGIDLDDCFEGDFFTDWASEVLGDYAGPMAETPSGNGIRIMMPRGPGDRWLGRVDERNGVGFFAVAGRAFTVPQSLAGGLGDLVRDDALVERVVALRDAGRAEEVMLAEAARQEAMAAFGSKWQGHWLAGLTPEDQQAAVEAMLQAVLPMRDEYHSWWLISAALNSFEAHAAGWSVYAAWARWSAGGEGFNDRENEYLWQHMRSGGGVSIFTLLHHARAAGFDIRPWHRKSMGLDEAAHRQWKEAFNREYRG